MLLNRIAVKIAFFLNGFLYANWVSRLTRIQEQFDADDGTIGLVLFTFAFGAFMAMPSQVFCLVGVGLSTTVPIAYPLRATPPTFRQVSALPWSQRWVTPVSSSDHRS